MAEKTPLNIYRMLLKRYGAQRWWPAETPFEVMIGAILTQRTSWKNVEIAIENLKKSGLMNIEVLANSSLKLIKEKVKPSGFYKVKAERVLNLARYLNVNYGNLSDFFSRGTSSLRKELLGLEGIGKETADSMLLYAGNKPVFVVDAYTKRLCERLPLLVKNLRYDNIQSYFRRSLPKSVKIYKEFHALIVFHGKEKCKTKPFCIECPLLKMCEFQKRKPKEKS